MRHELKSWPQFFAPVLAQEKTFEIRNNDRGFKIGDRIDLLEWNPDTGEYTGREIEGQIIYVTDFAQKEGFVVFQLSITVIRE